MAKSAHEWKTLIIVFAGLIFVAGVINLGYSGAEYGARQWPSLVQGVCYAIVGAIGVYAALKHDHQMAKLVTICLCSLFLQF
jgi:hypothetical protein